MKFALKAKGKFINRDVEDGYDTHLDDSAWEDVYLPHDWAVEREFSKDCSSGTGYLPGGIGWYRIPFRAPKLEDGEFSLCFHGVYKRCRVWCNNYYLGEWANGYTRFSFDITHAVRFDRENLLAVQVRHEDLADSRWYTGSGIEREVYLEILPGVHFREEEVLWTPQVEKPMAYEGKTGAADPVQGEEALYDMGMSSAQVSIPLVNRTGREQERILEVWLQDSCLSELPVVLTAGATQTFEITVPRTGHLLWSPEHPALYDLRVVLRNGGGRIAQEMVRKVGFVTTVFTPDRGFFCNGIPMKLKGVCLHEDAGSFGNAVPKNVWKRRLGKLKEMGTNAIRMSHNPHEEALYQLCDEMGFFVIDEIFDEWEGPKNKWWQGHNVYPPKKQGYYLDYPTWHARDVESFVKAGRVHTSVILWSIGNEIDYPNDPYVHESFRSMTGNNDAGKPQQERAYDEEKPNARRLVTLAKELTALVKAFDTTRPVSLASAFPELSSHTGLFDCLDVIGYNYKEAFYEEDHLRFPTKPIFGSENGHGYPAWQAVTAHEYIAGQFLWTGIDYLGETRGWPEHGSKAGHLTTAGMEKPDYYFRKSLWTTEPMVKLATWIQREDDWMEYRTFSWNYTPGETVRVEIYTNQPQAELFLNGERLGVYEKGGQGYIAVDVPFAPGELTAKVSKTADGENGVGPGEGDPMVLCDSLYTVTAPAQMTLSCEDEDAFVGDGHSYRQIEVTLFDAQGHRCVSDETLLSAHVEGAGVLAHMDNGNLGDPTAYRAASRKCFHGKLMIYIRSIESTGTVKLTVSGAGLKDGIYEFTAV